MLRLLLATQIKDNLYDMALVLMEHSDVELLAHGAN